MRKALIITFCIVICIAIGVFLLMITNGYEFPDKKKHAEIPFFPKTTNAVKFDNKRVDTMYVNGYQRLKKSGLLLVNYDKDTVAHHTEDLAIVNQSLKSVFHFKTSNYLHYIFDDVDNCLFIVDESADSVKNCIVFNVDKLKQEILHQLNVKKYEFLKDKLKVIKHFTSNTNFTSVVFLLADNGKYYVAKDKVATKISKAIILNEADNFNFSVPIIMAGDSLINSKNIQLFDKAINGNQLKKLMVYGTPSSPGGDGKAPRFDEDKGWFNKDRDYFFTMRLKNAEVKFKTGIFYNSETYFDELTEPKTDQDTLLYYSQNRLYQFYKK